MKCGRGTSQGRDRILETVQFGFKDVNKLTVYKLTL